MESETIFDEELFDRVLCLLELYSKEEKAKIAVEFAPVALRDIPDWQYVDTEMIQGLLDQIETLGDDSVVFARFEACFITGNELVRSIIKKFFFEARNETVISFLTKLEHRLLNKNTAGPS